MRYIKECDDYGKYLRKEFEEFCRSLYYSRSVSVKKSFTEEESVLH